MTILTCKVFSVEKITNTVYRIKLIPEADFNFLTGQYLLLFTNKYDKRPFSLASTPIETTFIELHIGISKFNLYAIDIIYLISNNCNIIVDIPYGKAWLRDDTNRPILLITSGIGFSYIRSILLTVLKF